MFHRWLPWKFIVRHFAKSFGFLDPISLFARLGRFGQPSEVTTPIELLRAGFVFHARGLMNTKAIQHNLDWVWPYWVRRQFDPNDDAFLPRAFSATHVNLTHRNWTAVGLPGCRAFPIVDPAGLLTPFFDGWSLDVWLLREDGEDLIASRFDAPEQTLHLDDDTLRVETTVRDDLGSLTTSASVVMRGGAPLCVLDCHAHDTADDRSWLAIVLRPFNPEGVSFVHKIDMDKSAQQWTLEDDVVLNLNRTPHRHAVSNYADGDVHLGIFNRPPTESITCRVGMATAAALYPVTRGGEVDVEVTVNLEQDEESKPIRPRKTISTWPDALAGACTADLPDERIQFLFNAGVRSLVLMSPGDTYPGPFTYKRFWFRDAVLILNALLASGLTDIARDVVRRWHPRQWMDGFFHSQEGEWDANGQVLWALHRLRALTGEPLDRRWSRAVIKGAHWIHRKRTDADDEALHAGLLPAGFSAEHLGNNDYYYWDDFWSVGGLRCAAALCREWDDADHDEEFRAEADDLMACIERSLERSRDIRRHAGLSASPYRRMDAGSIGSLAVGYPLQLWAPDDPRLLATVDYLDERCTVRGAFFQDMIHSGQNAYLTLHMAQVRLRARDPRFVDLVSTVADLASPTGQWPEAVHPRTGGGCMGDGQHIWAVADWVMMIRNMFVREEGDRLVLGSGIVPQWRDAGKPLRLGPTPTPWGPLRVTVTPNEDDTLQVAWEADWRDAAPEIEVALPGMEPHRISDETIRTVTVAPEA